MQGGSSTTIGTYWPWCVRSRYTLWNIPSRTLGCSPAIIARCCASLPRDFECAACIGFVYSEERARGMIRLRKSKGPGLVVAQTGGNLQQKYDDNANTCKISGNSTALSTTNTPVIDDMLCKEYKYIYGPSSKMVTLAAYEVARGFATCDVGRRDMLERSYGQAEALKLFGETTE